MIGFAVSTLWISNKIADFLFIKSQYEQGEASELEFEKHLVFGFLGVCCLFSFLLLFSICFVRIRFSFCVINGKCENCEWNVNGNVFHQRWKDSRVSPKQQYNNNNNSNKTKQTKN